jgi:hypothetical protein
LLQALLKEDLYASYLFEVRSKVDELSKWNGLRIIYQEENNDTGLYFLKSGTNLELPVYSTSTHLFPMKLGSAVSQGAGIVISANVPHCIKPVKSQTMLCFTKVCAAFHHYLGYTRMHTHH